VGDSTGGQIEGEREERLAEKEFEKERVEMRPPLKFYI
jgi:hypothetical protein